MSKDSRGAEVKVKVLERAKEDGFLLAHRNWDDVRNAYYEWCRKTETPFVVAHPRKDKGSVEVDLITTHRVMSDALISEVEELFARYSKRRKDWILGAVFCIIDGVPVDRLEELARELRSIAMRAAHS